VRREVYRVSGEEGKEVGRDGRERNGKRNCGRVGRDQGRKGKEGRNDREERTPSHNVHVVEGLCPYVRCFLLVHTAELLYVQQYCYEIQQTTHFVYNNASNQTMG